MTMQKRLTAAFTAAHIEYHWRFMMHYRTLGERWIGAGEALNSDRLLRLNRRINHHILCARKYEEKDVTYEINRPVPTPCSR